jgi:hypothetical protein
MDFDNAYAVVHQRVYAPVLFEKLARDYNIVPANETEARELLILADKCRQVYETRTAHNSNSVLKLAHASLDRQLHSLGVSPATPAADAKLVKSAAANGANDPQLAHAILSMRLGLGTSQN